jgi:hypothetical protein
VFVDKDVISGNEPPVDGMRIAVRLRRAFTITNAERLLVSARAAYIELNPGTTEHDAAEMVTSAADAIFTILEHDGVVGHVIDAALASHADHGLQVGGWRPQVTINETHGLPPGPDCFDPPRRRLRTQLRRTFPRERGAHLPCSWLVAAARQRKPLGRAIACWHEFEPPPLAGCPSSAP